MYKITVNDNFKFIIEAKKNELFVNDELVVLDEATLKEGTSHILFNGKSYTVETVEINTIEKLAKIKVNGNIYEVKVKDQFDQLLQKLGMDNLSSNKILNIKAPMPGLVLNVLKNEGDEVKKGDSLLILEAMKMENMIKSPTDGIIKKIEIVQGDKVEKNQLLITFS